MKLTVDASVVVKWFVSEPLFDNARLLLAHRLELHAPDIVLVELANVICRKVRRRELPASPRYLEEISNLRKIIMLHPFDDLIERAMQIALEIAHPVYDCLYLACAEGTASTLVTADRKLVNKVAGSSVDIDVRDIGADGFAEDMTAAATALVIRKETVARLVEAHALLAATREGVRTARHGQDKPFIIETSEDAEFYLDSPAYQRIARLLRELDDEERIDVLALGWFGEHRNRDWASLHDHACKMAHMIGEPYTVSLGHYWRDGYERLTGVSL